MVGEACVGPAHVIRGAANGAFEQISDPFLQDAVGGQTDAFVPLRLQILVNVGIYEAGVGAKIPPRPLTFKIPLLKLNRFKSLLMLPQEESEAIGC